jgi:hypothetical protein
MSESITCPNCKTEIPLTEAINHEVEERLRAEFADEREQLVAEKEQLLTAKDVERDTAVAAAREEEAVAASARAAEEVSVEMRDLQSQVDEQATLRQEAETRELELRAEKRKLEGERESLKLENERTLDKERAAIAGATREQEAERWGLKLREEQLIKEQMQKRIDDLQAAANQRRSGLQGEVMERGIEEILSESFPMDEIEPVKSGALGADVLQSVRSGRGDCGKLLWESKNHKNWSNKWIEKLRADQQRAKADVGIVVTAALPSGVDHIAFINGVWICDFASVLPLALMLRQQLDRITQARVIDTNRSDVADKVYEFLCGPDVQHFITNFVLAGLAQLTELEKERAVAERTFNTREQQVRAQLQSMAAFYGGLQGLAGGALPPVAALEPPPGDDESGPLALAS